METAAMSSCGLKPCGSTLSLPIDRFSQPSHRSRGESAPRSVRLQGWGDVGHPNGCQCFEWRAVAQGQPRRHLEAASSSRVRLAGRGSKRPVLPTMKGCVVPRLPMARRGGRRDLPQAFANARPKGAGAVAPGRDGQNWGVCCQESAFFKRNGCLRGLKFPFRCSWRA